MTGAEIAFGLAAIASATATTYSAVSSYQTGQYNAALAERQARIEKKRGEIAQEQIRRQAEETKSRQRAAYAARGVTMKGSPLQVIADSAIEFEKDAAIAQYNTDIGVSRAKSKAKRSKMKGQQALVGGLLETTGSLLTAGYGGSQEFGWWG